MLGCVGSWDCPHPSSHHHAQCGGCLDKRIDKHLYIWQVVNKIKCIEAERPR
jgi:hypothetical protein